MHPKRRVTWRTKLLLVAGSLLTVLLMLAAVEGLLRLVSIGAPDASRVSRLKYQQIFLPVLHPAELASGELVHQTVDARIPFQWIRREKPENCLRVFTFGGSATAGLGYSPNVTFARHLERILERAYPQHTVEVVNLGIVALSSKQVGLLVADVAERFAPDLMVVYSGNNEFLEIQAEKYSQAHANLASRAFDLLSDTNLYRALDRALSGGPRSPSLASQELTHEDLRVSQNQIIQDIEMTEDEIARVVDEYESNLDEMTRVTVSNEIPIMLLAVASNWRWRGREDLPDDWKIALVGRKNDGNESWDDGGDLDAAVRGILDTRLQDENQPNRHELLFRRASLNDASGDFESARRDYVSAMDSDPHLRRALTEMNRRVAKVAEKHGVPFLDTVAVLSDLALNHIVGFDEFYDYVHMTPRGTTLVGAEIFKMMRNQSLVPADSEFDIEEYVADQLRALALLDEDPLEVEEWLGFGFDKSGIADRDLWKYDRMLLDLDNLIAAEPKNAEALVYRGNSHYFRPSGAVEAARDYRAALELNPRLSAARANLDRLLLERDPDR